MSTQPTDITKEILVNVILDRSGSMKNTRAETITGYNQYIDSLREDKESQYNVSLIQFDSHQGPELTVTYSDKPISDVPALSEATYEPRGYTPLYDAIGECVRRVEAKDGRGVVTVIITDGEENASQEFTADSVRALIKEKESQGWKFIFLGANIDAFAAAGNIGINANDAANYAQGREQHVYASMASTVRSYGMQARSAGLASANRMRSFSPQARAAMAPDRPAAPPSTRPVAPPPRTNLAGGRPAVPRGFRVTPATPTPTKATTRWTVQR